VVTKRMYRGVRAGAGVEEGGGRLGEDDGRIRTRVNKITAHLRLEVTQYGGVDI